MWRLTDIPLAGWAMSSFPVILRWLPEVLWRPASPRPAALAVLAREFAWSRRRAARIVQMEGD